MILVLCYYITLYYGFRVFTFFGFINTLLTRDIYYNTVHFKDITWTRALGSVKDLQSKGTIQLN